MLAVVAVLGLGFAAVVPEAYADGTAKPLAGAEIAAKFRGNTASGKTAKGERWAEYYLTDGEIHGLWQGKDHYSGTWSVVGDKFCAKYPKSPESNYCERVGVDGTVLTYFKDDGSVDEGGSPYTLEPGNPNNL
jgi:hypothetical protein